MTLIIYTDFPSKLAIFTFTNDGIISPFIFSIFISKGFKSLCKFLIRSFLSLFSIKFKTFFPINSFLFFHPNRLTALSFISIQIFFSTTKIESIVEPKRVSKLFRVFCSSFCILIN